MRENKQILRQFMREHYTDERLVQLLDHARAGRLCFVSCCCFVGIVTADHDLRNTAEHYARLYSSDHLEMARQIPGALEAEHAFRNIGYHRNWPLSETESLRRRILIPMILAELKRRGKLREKKYDEIYQKSLSY